MERKVAQVELVVLDKQVVLAELDRQVELVVQVKLVVLVDLWKSPMMERTEY